MFEQLTAPSESVPQELSNEWSCQCVLTISNILGNFSPPPPLVTSVLEELILSLVNFGAHFQKWLDFEMDVFRLIIIEDSWCCSLWNALINLNCV
jgi:hypothetical protein